MSEFKVEKGIPIQSWGTSYPWDEMEVGDSFFAEGKKINVLTSAVSSRRKKYPEETYAARTRTENGVKGVRVWRVK